MMKSTKNLWKLIAALCALTAMPVLAEDSDALDTDTPVTFMEGDFYGEVINDENDALKAIMSVIDQLGGDEETVLDPLTIRPNEDGLSVYSFQQLDADTAVNGATVKLITDKDGHVCALSSSLIPGIDAKPLDEWAITAEDAEKVVMDVIEDDKMKVIEGASEQTLLPFVDDSSNFYYAWVVYTNNTNPEYDTGYVAHYVDEEGEYLFSVPVLQPGDTDSLSGEGALLAFLPYEADTWTGTVTKHDGTTKELSVPVLKDKETGEIFLGDLDRKILCIDYADFNFNDSITIRKEEDGRFADNELLIYDTFLRTYDYYATAGWVGPDGNATPVLLMMDMVDEYGDPIQNAAYAGEKHGYRTFEFNRLDPDGECTDIIAHEFTHCLTETLMRYTLYYNEYGAINEAFSDICGNIIEAAFGDTADTTWLIQENGNETLRSMSSPRDYKQPAFVWDMYYLPPAETVFARNDLGGVHINSSLLNLIGYRLNQTGMPVEDQLYFWMNVALAMTPRSDYNDLMMILPWCANTLGYSEYVPALEAAFEETGIGDLSLPDTTREGFGRIQYVLPFSDPDVAHNVSATFLNIETESEFTTSPEKVDFLIAATLPAGPYISVLAFYDDDGAEITKAVLCNDGWRTVSDDELLELIQSGGDIAFCTLESGDITEVGTDKQAALLAQLEPLMEEAAEQAALLAQLESLMEETEAETEAE